MSIEQKKINARIKSINKSTLFVAIIICMLIAFTPTASAKKSNAFPLALAKQICGGVSCAVTEAVASPSFENLTSDDFSGVDILKTVYDGVKIIGAFWVIIIAMTNLFKTIENGQDPVEGIMRFFTELGITLIFIMNLDVLSSKLAQLGIVIINLVGGRGSAEDAVDFTAQAEQLLIALTGESTGGFAWHIQAVSSLIIPYVVSWIAVAAAYLCIYQIMIEIGIRRAFMPMAVAEVYQDGLRSPGARYIKKYFSCFLKLAIIIVINALVGTIVSANTSFDGSAGPDVALGQTTMLVVLSLTTVGMMFRASEFANDIVGV